ncbi:MAG: sulfite exporter TauE/SafE family protein [Pseudomonadota bacterium]
MIDLFIQWWPFALSLLATGMIAGVLAGLLGVGGGIVIVPVLYNIFSVIGVDPDILMHLAVGTSLATIVPTSIRSLRSHAKKGAVDWALLKSWAPGLFIGVLGGSALAAFLNAQLLSGVFAVVALVVAFHMAFGKEHWRLGESIPTGARGGALTAGVGGVSAMMGIGGGTLGVPIMTLFGYPAQRAVATASGMGLIISIPGAMSFIIAGLGAEGLPPASLGYVSLLGFILITPMTVAMAPVGVSIAHAISHKMLKRAFAVFLAITAIRMGASLL